MKAVFMSVAEPNLGDSKKSDTQQSITLLFIIFIFRTVAEEAF